MNATGTLDLQSVYYAEEFVGARTDDCPPGLTPDQMARCSPVLEDVSLEAAMWQLSFGIRYAGTASCLEGRLELLDEEGDMDVLPPANEDSMT